MITYGAKSGICLENSFIISAGAKRDHESPLHTWHRSYNCMPYEFLFIYFLIYLFSHSQNLTQHEQKVLIKL